MLTVTCVFRLTSFVLKVFAKASKLNSASVDQNLLERAVHFLYTMQHTSGPTIGRFREYSQVSRHHGEMIVSKKNDRAKSENVTARL